MKHPLLLPLVAAALAAPAAAQIEPYTLTQPLIELTRQAGLGQAVPAPQEEAAASTPEARLASARAMALQALAERGLSLGYDPENDRFVTVGVAAIAVDPSHPTFGSLRSMAFQEALLDAQRSVSDYMGLSISTRAQRLLEMPPAERQGLLGGSSQQEDVALLTAEQAAALLESGQAEDGPGALREVLARSSFVDAVQVASAAEASAMQVLQSFESTPAGSGGTVAVIGVVSPGSRGMAAAMLGDGEVPAKAPKIPIGAWLRELGGETLLYTHGVLLRRDEQGELTLLAFGQATPESDLPLLVEAAREEAMLDAQQALRQFVGLQIDRQASRVRALDVEAFRGEAERARQQFRSARELRSSVHAIAERVTLHGVVPVHAWEAVHPVAQAAGNGVPTIGVVLSWKVSSRDQARGLLEAGASAEEPAAGPAAPTPVGGSGKGAKGDVDDL